MLFAGMRATHAMARLLSEEVMRLPPHVFSNEYANASLSRRRHNATLLQCAEWHARRTQRRLCHSRTLRAAGRGGVVSGRHVNFY